MRLPIANVFGILLTIIAVLLLIIGFCTHMSGVEYVPTYPTREKPHDPSTFRVTKSEDKRYAVVETPGRVRLYRRKCTCVGTCQCRKKRNLIYVDIQTARTITVNRKPKTPCRAPMALYYASLKSKKESKQ